MKDKEKEPKEELPSAADDCADVTSKHERFKKTLDKPKSHLISNQYQLKTFHS